MPSPPGPHVFSNLILGVVGLPTLQKRKLRTRGATQPVSSGAKTGWNLSSILPERVVWLCHPAILSIFLIHELFTFSFAKYFIIVLGIAG